MNLIALALIALLLAGLMWIVGWLNCLGDGE